MWWNVLKIRSALRGQKEVQKNMAFPDRPATFEGENLQSISGRTISHIENIEQYTIYIQKLIEN